jgi:hypothetical protein
MKERLVIETNELMDRLNKLNEFMATDEFYHLDRVNKDLLYEQNILMTKYLQVLGKRLELLNIKLK